MPCCNLEGQTLYVRKVQVKHLTHYREGPSKMFCSLELPERTVVPAWLLHYFDARDRMFLTVRSG